VSRLREISIDGLFGLYDHALELRQEPPLTIVAGPNGIGKTTLLRLSTALLAGSYPELSKHDFARIEVVSAEGVRISATPLPAAEGEDFQVLLRQSCPGQRRPKEETIKISSFRAGDLRLPAYIEPYGADTFMDARDGELLSAEEVVTRWGRRPGVGLPMTEPPEWFDRGAWAVDFIETKRLDTLMTTSARKRRHSGAAAPIHRYLEVVANTLERARRDSAQINQASTRSVARRLLTEYSRKSVKPEALRLRYARVGDRASVLTANGLLSDSLEVLPDGKLNPTEKRFLELFLDDFEAKLAPLEPVSAKVNQLRAIVEPKFLNKSIKVDPARGITFIAKPHDEEIDPVALSSGEQHELALMTRLLFNEEPGTTVLIDEPELSLHVSWQHGMVEDLEEIARVAGLSFVLATHSTAIINGRWDLVEELGPLEKAREAPEREPESVLSQGAAVAV
jgi:energy-coupling factor transporter ATP-binding protein EcfA2